MQGAAGQGRVGGGAGPERLPPFGLPGEEPPLMTLGLLAGLHLA